MNPFILIDDNWNGTLTLFRVDWSYHCGHYIAVNPEYKGSFDSVSSCWSLFNELFPKAKEKPAYEMVAESQWDYLIPETVLRKRNEVPFLGFSFNKNIGKE